MKSLIVVVFIMCFVKISIAQSVKKTMKRIPDTGQTTSYTTTFGEDNDYTINPPFYIDNGDGTITDTVTGLMWQKTDGGEMTIDSAKKYVQQLNLAGHHDWRLPNVHESFSILILDALNPAINTTYFPNTNAEYWWANDTAYNFPSKIWVTNAGGGQGAHPKTETISAGGTKSFHTRAVRDVTTPTIIPNHFTDNGDSTITDNLTGLMWEKFPYNDTLFWDNALQHAENLTLAGYSDWRLPNIKEIESLNDEKANAPSINISAFPNVVAKKYWSSTSQFNQGGNAWFIDFQNYGLTSYESKTTRGCYVMCVRTATPKVSGINSLVDDESELKLYPNPANQSLVISHKSLVNTIDVMDVFGKIVFNQSIKNSTIQPIIIDVSNFSPQIYFVRTTDTKGFSSIAKFVKQ